MARMREWIDCEIRMPEETREGIGTHSEVVEVLLKSGRQDEDFLINGKWVTYCRSVGDYPVAWRCKNERS